MAELDKQLLAIREKQRREQKKSFAFFVTTFVMMWTKEGGDPIPFTLWDFQVEAANTFQKKKKLIVLKARQMGMSWLAMAYVVWCVLNKSNFHVYITSIGLKEVNEQMERIRFIWYNLPDWLKAGVELGGKGCKDNDSLIEFSNGSAIHAIASTKAGGHGAAPGLYILDEFARKDNDIMAWRAIKPSLGRHSQVIIISTSNGFDNLFASLWFDAQSGSNEFSPLFFSAAEHPEYSEEYLAEMKRDFAGDLQGYMEAFPMKPEDAFLASSRGVFDSDRIRQWMEHIRSEEIEFETGYIDVDDSGKRVFVEDEVGNLLIWKRPEVGHQYTAGCDLAEGLVHGDWSVTAVLDVDTDEIVALFRAKIAPEEYAYPVHQLARYYNDAWLVVEVNKNSELVMQDLKTQYPFLYCRQHREKITDKPTLVPGFIMTGYNKPPLIAKFRRYFSDTEKPLRIYSETILNEMSAFEETEGKKLGAVKGKHDDCVIAVALAIEGKSTMPATRATTGRGVRDMFSSFGGGSKSRRSWQSL